MKDYSRCLFGNVRSRNAPAVPLVCMILALMLAVPAGASLSESVKQMLIQSGYKPSNVGVLVRDMTNDSVLIALNAEEPFIPASVQKLVTASAAIDLLGIDYRFQTKVFAGGAFDRDSGTIQGDLYVRGGGDPGFLAERLWLFVQHITHQGVRAIKGDLVLDDCFFSDNVSGPGFSEDKSSRAYEAPTAALSASFNTVAVHVAPGSSVGSPVHVRPFPSIRGVKIVSTALTTAADKPSGIQVKTEEMDGRTAILVYGGMSIDAKPRYVYRKVWQTWENFGWVLQALFDECGIVLEGRVRRACVPDSVKASGPLYEFTSKPLTEFIGHMFKYSSNFAAEMVFRTIDAEKGTGKGTWKGAGDVIRKWWKAQDLPGAIPAANGSGMGNRNRLSPAQAVALLTREWRAKTTAPDFVSALSVAGVDGTLERRFGSSRLKGIVRAKTGTLNNYGVGNLAGFVLLPDRTLVFAVLINNSGPDQYRHWETHQRILELSVPSPKKKRAGSRAAGPRDRGTATKRDQ
ncbi:MAG: D-alanyl-D-alanine carboxypeptidase/D-alanyl-D-alanine-endopeptidase [Chitinivibrionales bacterium]|nr:D-alanyl-D-alanine carboxypeptidase/D-alanyl-D-alanine-endopeptidase [Chitinivibrionales bacterium]MBD3397156.1 D-alanyl-D-alanine carboxypeptidase/D-alanyl-D-alanine-endopeptidase [Chitinivibrionales bacterium]